MVGNQFSYRFFAKFSTDKWALPCLLWQSGNLSFLLAGLVGCQFLAFSLWVGCGNQRKSLALRRKGSHNSFRMSGTRNNFADVYAGIFAGTFVSRMYFGISLVSGVIVAHQQRAYGDFSSNSSNCSGTVFSV